MGTSTPENMMASLNELKRKMFFDLLELAGRVFVIVKYSEDVIIGTRGFLKDEEQNGLILVFNERMHFIWSDETIEAHLVFGTQSQHCFIPVDSVVAVYSPELQVQFIVTYQQQIQPDQQSVPSSPASPPSEVSPSQLTPSQLPPKERQPREIRGDTKGDSKEKEPSVKEEDETPKEGKVLKVDFTKKKKH